MSQRVHVLFALVVILTALGFILTAIEARARASAAMAEAAKTLLAALSAEQRAKATFGFEDAQRFDWHFIPRQRAGVSFKEMTPAQRKAAHDLVKAGLSQRGYLKASAIIDLELILRDLEGGRAIRDPELYFFSIFGTPSPKDTWGWRVEGHHLSLNFTVVKGTMVATSPSFMGANPAEVRQGPQKGLRILHAEEDLARALLEALDEKQRAQALFEAAAPRDIVTGNTQKADPLAPAGIAAGALTPPQMALLQKLLDEYINNMPPDLAAERSAKLRRAGLETIHFAWAGSAERGKPHYYRLQGPSFLVEYDNTQNDANHIHTAWRDFEGDFGRDLLREHYKTSAH